MRIYVDWPECYEEVKRDLAEMGILVKPKTMQDKIIENNQVTVIGEVKQWSFRIILTPC